MSDNASLKCLGLIMDGNRRWAKEQGLSTLEGHRQGGEVFLDSIKWASERHIPHVVYYAFSTENWQRSEEEVSYLMQLFREYLNKIKTKKGNRVRVRVIGRRTDFSTDIQRQIEEIEAAGENDNESVTTVWVALSYGGRTEIIEAVNQAVRGGKEVTEETFKKLLWTAEMPDPDLIVRTGGEYRLSNFITWGSVYSELHFIDKYWPALTKDDFDAILMEYDRRERRKGK